MYHRRKYSKLLDVELQKSVEAKFAELQSKDSQDIKDPGLSVLSLSLKDVDKLTPETIQQTIDQLKTFLFAGHDTTSTLLQWCFYELGRSPRIAQTLREELDTVLGPETEPAAVSKAILEGGEELLSKLTYTSAVVKEILRLYPPAGSARMVPPGSGFMVRSPDGSENCLDGMVIYLGHYSIQRNPTTFGETADDFLPERWVGNVDTSAEEDGVRTEQKGQPDMKIPVSSWRPFERGPRNCIGQGLANIEARVAIACLARRYDFIKVGMGALLERDGKPVLNAKGQYEVSDPMLNVSFTLLVLCPLRYSNTLFQTRQITSKPLDNMMMKARYR